MDTYERQLEQMRQALANAWWEGHVDGCDDPPFCVEMSDHRERNPYVKEN